MHFQRFYLGCRANASYLRFRLRESSGILERHRRFLCGNELRRPYGRDSRAYGFNSRFHHALSCTFQPPHILKPESVETEKSEADLIVRCWG
jgi:hypothetical protein